MKTNSIEQYKRISMVKECIQRNICDDCDHCITDDNIRYFCKLNKEEQNNGLSKRG